MGEVSQSPDGLIVIIAKAPRAGKVKTRLCPPLNLSQAAVLYTAFLLDTVELALKVSGVKVMVSCPTPEDADELKNILPQAVGYIIQDNPGLTGALTEGFVKGLAAGFSKVLCISSDNPTLPGEYLAQGVQSLETSDLALGPTDDGGYYLIGAKKVYPFLFNNMVWSTTTVMSETVKRAEEAALQVNVLPCWYDLDTGAELERFREELKSQEPEAGFHTRQALSTVFIETAR